VTLIIEIILNLVTITCTVLKLKFSVFWLNLYQKNHKFMADTCVPIFNSIMISQSFIVFNKHVYWHMESKAVQICQL